MRLVIVGASGQVGSDLALALGESGENFVALSRSELDITDRLTLHDKLASYEPDVIVNCSVYHPVDECESHPQQSFAVNAIAVRELAIVARDIGASLVHFSSDYVFDGQLGRPYHEEDTPGPINVFGASKVAGEQLVRAVSPRHFIIRTSGLYGLTGSRVKRGNFVETMLRLGAQNGKVRVVDDLRMAQTYTRDLAKQTLALVRTNNYGTYHASDHGGYSWYEFARRIFEFSSMDVTVIPVPWSEMAAGSAPRPRYSVLENRHLKLVGLDKMQTIDDALQEYLEARGRTQVQAASLSG
jgi:dTDP-4-dehydrorhamnose reductase